jgi:cation-transporting ATPase E
VLLGALLVAILVIGPIQDALFGLVLIVNTPIGLVQELRAKRALDRLTVVTTQSVRVMRDAAFVELPSSELVIDDVFEVRQGDQIPVDGIVLESRGLESDESLLTGEAAPQEKTTADAVLSGSFLVAGEGLIRATNVGQAAYGNALAAEARRFTPVRSELRRGVNRFLVVIGVLIVPIGALLVFSQISANDSTVEAVRSSVAGLVTMVPEGLVLLTSVVFAVAAIRFAQRGILAQELASVEMLARADVICLDKTGTLSDGHMTVDRVIPIGDAVLPEAAIAALAAADPSPNRTMVAIGEAFQSSPGWSPLSVVPFSSSRKWSAATFHGHGTWVMGAPDVLTANSDVAKVAQQAADLSTQGARVVLVGRAPSSLASDSIRPEVDPAALIVLRERLRPDASQTIAYYRDQGVAVKVVSGDHPQTVAAIASAVGVPHTSTPVDGRDLPRDVETFADLVEKEAVFGRMSPGQKRDLVQALQSRGHVVAMTGDGVNDVLALKKADIGVAMGSGSAATQAVARLILLHDSFASLPFAIREGRRVIANLERVAAFFLTKTVYAMVLSMAVVLRVMPFPLLPRQLSLIGLLAIGIPAFALSFAPSAERARSQFVTRTLRFVIPAGLVAGVASYVAFELATAAGAGLDDGRTVATVVLLGVGLWIVGRVAWPLALWKVMLIAAMLLGAVVAFLLPFTRMVYGLTVPGSVAWLTCAAVIPTAILALEAALRAVAAETRTLGSIRS